MRWRSGLTPKRALSSPKRNAIWPSRRSRVRRASAALRGRSSFRTRTDFASFDPTLLRVFARKLRGHVRVEARGLLPGLLMDLEAGLACPAALQIVPYAESQPAEPFGFELDRVAVH